MDKFISFILLSFIRFALWFRYRVKIKGLENLNSETLNKPGGILFLPNHPTVFVDPTLVTLAVFNKYPIRPLIVEYMYYLPIVNWFMKRMNALPIPNFGTSSNSLKKKKADKVVETVIHELKKGDNFLIYPAGKVKHQAREQISGSAVHRIVQSVPEANIVLVRTVGLWGSSFSRALTGSTPSMFKQIFNGMKKVFKNLLLFTPRREVTIELVPVGPDFPYQASRLEFNRYLEKWYNRPDGLTDTTEEEPGDSLYLVSYSRWREELPTVYSQDNKTTANIDLEMIPIDIQNKVKNKLFEMTQIPPSQIYPDMNLGTDLGLDSLDNAELLTFLDDQYDVSGVPVNELTTVKKVMALAAKQVTFGEAVEEELSDLSQWNQPRPQAGLTVPDAATIHEAFLRRCDQMGNAAACGDARAGVLTYANAKLRVVLLAEYIRHLPGEYIGILLPSSVAAYLTVLACQLAGKIPLMVNWTVGSKHLESVVALSKVQVVLSSWAFLDRLDNVDLKGIEDLIVTLEDARSQFTLKDKVKAFFRSKKKTDALLSAFNVQNMKKEAPAVLLFTSGTESMPKGVPLSHENILSNQRAAIHGVPLVKDDVLLGILPPFHAFGFTVSGLLPLLIGLRVAYYADPTNGKGVAKAIERWSGSVICGAPNFLRGMFKNAQPGQLKTLTLCVTGAEKAPPDLFQMVYDLKHCALIEGYGITECSPVLTINREGNPKQGVGEPLPGVDICIIDLESHQPIAQGQQGLIVAKGPNIFAGYLNKGLSSPFVSVNGEHWYSTGDLGYIDSQGNLILSGRLKRFVKVGGEMISLAAIEEALHHQLVPNVQMETDEEGPILAICAKEEAGEKPKIFLFTRFRTSIEEANKSLREAGFSNLVKIFKVQQLAEIPVMGTGKINYRALEAQLSTLNNSNNHQQEVMTKCGV